MPRAEWVLDKMADCCEHCQMKFRAGYKPGSYTRKHHCRRCGRVFCYNCTSSKVPLCQSLKMGGWSEEAKPSKVCLRCFAALSGGGGGGGGGGVYSGRSDAAGGVVVGDSALQEQKTPQRDPSGGGADTEALDAADDTDDPKAAVIAHILELQSRVNAPTEQEIRDELEPLKLRALKVRAKEQGLAEAALEELDDADDPKAAAIDALVELLFVPAEGVPPAQPKASVRELRRTAASAGVPSPAIDAALDDADPAAALETLIASTRRASDAGNARKKELTQLPVRRLRELSAEAGATEATIEACLDSDTPKPSLVELLLKLERQREEAKESQLREMRAQLMQLPLREVRQRAITAGASADSIDDALDNDNAKDAMVDVALAAAQQCPPTTSGGGAAVPALETPKPKAKEAASAVRKASAPSGEKPHFGSTGKLAPVALPEGRHVMLSYQWSQQDKVVRVRKALQARGVNCWMDIDGGMKSDVRKSKNFIHSRKSY